MALNDLRLATGPVSWGVDFADAPDNPPWTLVLDEIGQSGVGALELGPVGYLPEDPGLLREALTCRGLTAVGSFVFDDLHDASRRHHVLDTTERACRAVSAARGTILVIIDRPCPARSATAGRAAHAGRLPNDVWRYMIGLIADLAKLVADHGLRPAFHPHAGSYVEFPDEIDRLLDDTDIGLCLDTGHAAYAGMQADKAIREYASRLVHVHLKDVDQGVLRRVGGEQLGFWQAIDAGVFCPLGHGVVNIDRLVTALDATGYSGFATIEQDRVPGHGSPREDLDASLRVLADAGIASADAATSAAAVAAESRGPRTNEPRIENTHAAYDRPGTPERAASAGVNARERP